MSTRRQLAGLTLGTAAALAVGTPTAAAAAPGTSAGQPSGEAAPLSTGRLAAGRQPEQDPITLTAVRTALSLPNLPSLGVPYAAVLDLFNEEGQLVGDALAPSMVVGVTLNGPVVQSTVVLRLADGEIVYQRIIDRFGGYPREAVGAILGGTGAYQAIRGQVDITWPNADEVNLVVNPV